MAAARGAAGPGPVSAAAPPVRPPAPGSAEIVPNALETRRFGIACAGIDGLGPALPDLAAVDRAARDRGIRLLTVRVDARALPRVHALEAQGYRLMDTLVYWRRDLEALSPPDLPCDLPGGGRLRPAVPADAAAVRAVAEAAFRDYMGHYHADPRLEDAAADAAYVEWAETSVSGMSPERPVLLAETGGAVAGFLTLRLNRPDEAEIVLNAVHPARQRGGLYRGLVAGAAGLAAGLGARELIVSTQIVNLAVQRVWARQGFAPDRSLYTFHKWFD